MRQAADAGSPQAQYALATFYKEGRGVAKDTQEATRLLAAAARAGMTEAEVEYGIALFNGTGTRKDESAALGYFLKAAKKNNPIGQNRLALMYATGRGVKADPVEAGRWHLIATAGGDIDQFLDDFMTKMKPSDRAAAEDKAKPWIARMKALGPTPFPQAAEEATKP
jgi:TPR repeat protein